MHAGQIATMVTAAPTHSAPEGSLAWDKTNNKLYINNDGSTGWTEIGAGSGPTLRLVASGQTTVSSSQVETVDLARQGAEAVAPLGWRVQDAVGNTWDWEAPGQGAGGRHIIYLGRDAEANEFRIGIGGVSGSTLWRVLGLDA